MSWSRATSASPEVAALLILPITRPTSRRTRCGHPIEAVFYEDYVMCYCPHDQTDDKLLKDRRLSRLLK